MSGMKSVTLVFSCCIILSLFKNIKSEYPPLDAALADFGESFANQFAASIHNHAGSITLPGNNKTFSSPMDIGKFSLHDGWVSTGRTLKLLGVDTDVLEDRSGKLIYLTYLSPQMTLGYSFGINLFNLNCQLSGNFTVFLNDVRSKIVFTSLKETTATELRCTVWNATVDLQINPEEYYVEFHLDVLEGIQDTVSYMAEKIINSYIKYRVLDTVRDTLEDVMMQLGVITLKKENEEFQKKGIVALCENLNTTETTTIKN